MKVSFIFIAVALTLCIGVQCLQLTTRQKSSTLRSSITSPHAAISLQDIEVSTFALGASALWIKLWTSLAKKGIIQPKLSRKIIHTSSAPLFMCLWPLYTNEPTARLVASAVPLAQIIRLLVAGLKQNSNSNSNSVSSSDTAQASPTSGKQEQSHVSKDANMSVDNDLINAISRSGDMKEALGGPLIYSAVLFLGTALYFKSSVVGAVAISQMAVGDGLADIVGRKWGTTKWPFSNTKSIIGTIAFIVSSFLFSVLILSLFSYCSTISIDIVMKLPLLLLISVVCASVELITIVDDNITVPVVAVLLSSILLQ